MSSSDPRVFVCYVPGLDRRRIDAERTPFIHDLLERSPSCRIRTIPATELVPTFITGVWPHEHGIWQLRLPEDARDPRPRRLFARLPDLVTTTVQCVRHALWGPFDLCSIEPARRDRFELHRFKFNRRAEGRPLDRVGRTPSIFGLMGERSRFLFKKSRLSPEEKSGAPLPSGRYALELVEFYPFDITSHWNLDRPEVMARASREADDLVRALHERSREEGIRFVLLVDHGQELIRHRINLRRLLRATGVPRNEYDVYMEVSIARLWFHTDRARETIMKMLGVLERVTVKGYRDLHELNVAFDDDSFGEVYVFADHGAAFFPHDYYQPIANLLLGLSAARLRPRTFNARHRANHGQLPDHPAEEGYMVLADEKFMAVAETIQLIDVAPTLLELAGEPVPEHMKGRAAFRMMVAQES